MMRILMLTDDVIIDRRILLEARSLVESGHEVIIIAGGNKDLPQYEIDEHIKIERLQPSNNALSFEKKLNNLSYKLPNIFSRIFFIKLAKKVIRRLFKKDDREKELMNKILFYNPDIIHVHDLPQLKIGVIAKQKLHVPLIYDAHELYPEIHTLTQKEKINLARLEKQFITHCDEVITVNEFIANEMHQRYKIEVPKVIYNAAQNFNLNQDESKNDLFRKNLNISKSDKILLYQGWMSKSRGLQILVKSMQEVQKNIHLVMMGYGHAIPELKSIVKKFGLEERVHIIDAVPQQELLYWTSSADVGIIPYQHVDLNNYYCSPNKLFEFIQGNLPIIANDLPFLRKVIEGEQFGLVAKLETLTDYNQLINAIFADKFRLASFKKNISLKASAYAWPNEEKKLFQLYKKYLLKTSHHNSIHFTGVR